MLNDFLDMAFTQKFGQFTNSWIVDPDQVPAEIKDQVLQGIIDEYETPIKAEKDSLAKETKHKELLDETILKKLISESLSEFLGVRISGYSFDVVAHQVKILSQILSIEGKTRDEKMFLIVGLASPKISPQDKQALWKKFFSNINCSTFYANVFYGENLVKPNDIDLHPLKWPSVLEKAIDFFNEVDSNERDYLENDNLNASKEVLESYQEENELDELDNDDDLDFRLNNDNSELNLEEIKKAANEPPKIFSDNPFENDLGEEDEAENEREVDEFTSTNFDDEDDEVRYSNKNLKETDANYSKDELDRLFPHLHLFEQRPNYFGEENREEHMEYLSTVQSLVSEYDDQYHIPQLSDRSEMYLEEFIDSYNAAETESMRRYLKALESYHSPKVIYAHATDEVCFYF